MAKLCDKHLEPFSLYCNHETCQRPICNLCTPNHQSHEIFDCPGFADYLSSVLEAELQAYDKGLESVKKLTEQANQLSENIINKSVKRLRRIQDIVKSIQEQVSVYLRNFEDMMNGLNKHNSRTKEELEKMISLWESKLRQYKEMVQVVDKSKNSHNFKELYKVWIFLGEQTSMEIFQQEMDTIFPKSNYKDSSANEIQALVASLNDILNSVNNWEWMKGKFY